MSSSPSGTPIPSEDDFFMSTYRRLVGTMVALALLTAPALWIRYGRIMCLVFLIGSAIALANFHWLRRSIEALASRMGSSGRKPSPLRVIARFLLRYLLIAAAAYAILKSTASNLNGLFFGLSLPVGAILIEAIYQVIMAFRTQTLDPRN